MTRSDQIETAETSTPGLKRRIFMKPPEALQLTDIGWMETRME